MVFKITGNLKSSNNPEVAIGKPLDFFFLKNKPESISESFMLATWC